eukprot:3961-Heterococcus_DN1.PRE.2
MSSTSRECAAIRALSPVVKSVRQVAVTCMCLRVHVCDANAAAVQQHLAMEARHCLCAIA